MKLLLDTQYSESIKTLLFFGQPIKVRKVRIDNFHYGALHFVTTHPTITGVEVIQELFDNPSLDCLELY